MCELLVNNVKHSQSERRPSYSGSLIHRFTSQSRTVEPGSIRAFLVSISTGEADSEYSISSSISRTSGTGCNSNHNPEEEPA